MKKKKFVITILTFVIIYILILSYIYLDNKNDTKHTYQIRITTDLSNNYTIYVPVPQEWDNDASEPRAKKVSGVIDKLKVIEGLAQFSLIKTEHGKALMIIGSGNSLIKGESNVDTTVMGNPLTLSLKNYSLKDRNRKYWIYSDIQDTDQVSINIYYTLDLVDETVRINGILNGNNWQLINSTHSW